MPRFSRSVPVFVFFMIGLLALGGCSDEGSDPVSPGPDPDPDPISFAADIQPIFNANCVGCHGLGGNGGLDLREGSAYGNLVGIDSQGYPGKRVMAGEPADSVLYLKLTGDSSTGTRMPPAGLLPQAQRDLVRDWIAEGAADN